MSWTREQAIEYFMEMAVCSAVSEGFEEARHYEDSEAEAFCKLHEHYEDCARYLLGLPRSYQAGFGEMHTD